VALDNVIGGAQDFVSLHNLVQATFERDYI